MFPTFKDFGMAFNKRTFSSINFDRSPETATVPSSRSKAKAKSARGSSPFLQDLIRLGGASAVLATLSIRPVDAFTPSTSPPQSPTPTTFLTATAVPQKATELESVNATTTPPIPLSSYLGGIVVYQKDDNSWATKCWNDVGLQVDCATWTGYHYTWNSQGLPISPTNGISSATARSDARYLKRSLVMIMVFLIVLGLLPTATALSAKATSPTSPTLPTLSAEMVPLGLPRNNLSSAAQSMLIDLSFCVLVRGFNLVIIGGLMISLLSRAMRNPVKDRETAHDPKLIPKKSEVNDVIPPIGSHDPYSHLSKSPYWKLSSLLQAEVAIENLNIAGTVTLCDPNGVCQEARSNEGLPTGPRQFHLRTLLLVIAMTLGIAALRVPMASPAKASFPLTCNTTSIACVISSTNTVCDGELRSKKGIRIPTPGPVILPNDGRASAGPQGTRLSPLAKLVLIFTLLAIFLQCFPKIGATSTTPKIQNLAASEVISGQGDLREKPVYAGTGGGIITITSGGPRILPPMFLRGLGGSAVSFIFVAMVMWFSFSPIVAGLANVTTPIIITDPALRAREPMQTQLYSNTYTVISSNTGAGNRLEAPRIFRAITTVKLLSFLAVAPHSLSYLSVSEGQHQNQPQLLPSATLNATSISRLANQSQIIFPTINTNTVAPAYATPVACSVPDSHCSSVTTVGALVVPCTLVCGSGSVSNGIISGTSPSGDGAKGYQILRCIHGICDVDVDSDIIRELDLAVKG